MYKTPAEAAALMQDFLVIDAGDGNIVELLLFPAMTSRPAVTEAA
jgi:hypothetical protein